MNIRFDMLRSLFKFLLCDHGLEIETGRWEDIPQESRYCRACWNHDIAVIGDEYHCLNECVRYRFERNIFSNRLAQILPASAQFSAIEDCILRVHEFSHNTQQFVWRQFALFCKIPTSVRLHSAAASNVD